MNYIKKFLDLYLSKKNNHINLKLILNFFIAIMIFAIVIIMIENYIYFKSNIKIKIFNIIMLLTSFGFFFLVLRTIIHKYHFFNNSKYQDLALELIKKLPTKDRIINALQIYSQINTKNSYSDLTIKAVNDLEEEIKGVNLENIKIKFPLMNLYALVLLCSLFSCVILFSENHYSAFNRILNKQTSFEKPLPFEIQFNNSKTKYSVFKNENLEGIISGNGLLPPEIDLNWLADGKKNTKKINLTNQSYEYIFKNIKSNMKIWAEYSNNSILKYNNYKIQTDTISVVLKERPEIKELNIIIEPPKYTKTTGIKHTPSLSKIKLLKGSIIHIKGLTNKKLESAELRFKKDNTINMDIKDKIITAQFEAVENTNFEIICSDFENNKNIKIEYFLEIVDDLNPYVSIKYPPDNFKIDENYNIDLTIEVLDDFGINEIFLEYNITKPYYLNQDTISNQLSLLKNSENNKTNQFLNYKWDISNLNIGPGDEIFYLIKAIDNNTKTGPGIGKSAILRAYFPNLEELYFEVEQEQEIIEDTFDDVVDSIDEIKDMYQTISNDVLKEQTGLEQEQEAQAMAEELQEISDKIENLEKTINTIKELNEKNDLISDALGEKIQKLQQMFQEAINSDLMDALQNLQKSLNKDNFEQSLEDLNNFDFEINDLEQQLDRMIELFEQVVAEQKLNELTKKIDEMENLQEDITKKIDENSLNQNIMPMENKQIDNLEEFKKTLDETNKLMENINPKLMEAINDLSNGEEIYQIEEEINNMLSDAKKNKSEMKQISENIEKNIKKMSNDLEQIIENHQKKASIEMLNLYTRIIKSLIDMSFEQEQIISIAKNIKSKKDSKINLITSKENIILQQYKNIFIQISDLSNKSFHINAEVSKTFSQIFNSLVKTISAFEQGKITIAKKNQPLIIEYINKTILLLIEAMSNMQQSGEASGYSQYLASMEQLTKGQQALNQGMGSLLPMPFGEQPGSEGLMQSLMQQQQQLTQQLEQLINENSFAKGENTGGLGKALEDMNEIIRDFENQQISQESINRGERAYKKLLEHQNAIKNRGLDEKWEAEQNYSQKLLNNDMNKLKSTDNAKLKELYKTLEKLDQNQNLTKENKIIIQEYLKILIKENLNEK